MDDYLKLYEPLHKKAEHNKKAKSETTMENKDIRDIKREHKETQSKDETHNQNNERVDIEIIIHQGKQLKYNKRQGSAGVSSQRYETNLAVLFLLQGITKKEDGIIDSFYLATNMEEAGDFDDEIFKYTGGELKKSKILFIQAKQG